MNHRLSGSGPQRPVAPLHPPFPAGRAGAGRGTSAAPSCPLPRRSLAAMPQAAPTWEELLGQR